MPKHAKSPKKTGKPSPASEYAKIQVHYFCPTCQYPFVVFHEEDGPRNTHCWHCKGEVTLTGKVDKLEGDEIVTYQDGIKVGSCRRPRKLS